MRRSRLPIEIKQKLINYIRLILPPELERELTVVEFALPGKDQLCPVLNGVLESASLSLWPCSSRARFSMQRGD